MLQQQQTFETFEHDTKITTETDSEKQHGKIEQPGAFLAKVIANSVEHTSENNENISQLYLEINDIVTIEGEIDDHYYLAKFDQQIGKLARSECSILDKEIPLSLCQYLTDNQFFDLHICFASFVAQDVGDLSTTRGDIIVATNHVNEHWQQGQVCYDGQANCWPTLSLGKQAGTFPLNHCWKLDSNLVKLFCVRKLNSQNQVAPHSVPWTKPALKSSEPLRHSTNSSSISSGTSSLCTAELGGTGKHDHSFGAFKVSSRSITPQQMRFHDQPSNNDKVDSKKEMPPPRPIQLPRQISERQKSASEQIVSRPSSILSIKQQDKLKGWLNTVRKKTARCAMRISANLGFISLIKDEEFEKHYASFKQLEKSIKVFIKNLTLFVEHFESFLLALQNTSDNLADFYRDKALQKEINELRKKNKALNCEHFHSFKRTIDRQVISVSSQLLQKFSGPHQLAQKRTAKLLDFETKAKEMESCRDSEKKATLFERYVIAKDLYDRINRQLIEELPLFNQFALDIFKECIFVLLDSRKNLILSYTKQTESLLRTPLLSSFTASDVASTIMMTCDFATNQTEPVQPPAAPLSNTIGPLSSTSTNSEVNSLLNQDHKGDQKANEHGTQSRAGVFRDDNSSRPQSALSQLSSEFDQMALANRDICSTPLSQISSSHQTQLNRTGDNNTSVDSNFTPYDEPDTVVRFPEPGDANSDNKQNENIESAIEATKADNIRSSSAAQSQDGDHEVAQDAKKKEKKKARHPIYVASWPFVATGPNQLTISCNQQLKVLKGCDSIGNPDWSLVKNQSGEIGYVPSSYLKRRGT